MARDQSDHGSVPLPRVIIQEGDLPKLESPNLSLRYFKFADVFSRDWNKLANKPGFLNKLVEHSRRRYSVDAFETRKKWLDQIGDGFSLITATRLTFGLGYQHATEIGFTFDWTTGLAVIPGSSLKGVSLSFAKSNSEIWDPGLRAEIFGSKHQAGRIAFLPAYPCLEDGQRFLEVDVMTPHYGPYYSDPHKNPPADWYNPNPIYFLTVPKGVRFCFRLADLTNLAKKRGQSDLLDNACRILESCLTESGVGAKTAVDYGRFE